MGQDSAETQAVRNQDGSGGKREGELIKSQGKPLTYFMVLPSAACFWLPRTHYHSETVLPGAVNNLKSFRGSDSLRVVFTSLFFKSTFSLKKELATTRRAASGHFSYQSIVQAAIIEG